MQLYRSMQSLRRRAAPGPRVAAIGSFDGLHLGHRRILETALEQGRHAGEPVVACSFEPMPAEFFAAETPPARLTCFRERFELLDALGLDEMFCPRFESVRALAPERYIEAQLVEALDVSHVVVGRDFRFGHGRRGTLDHLRAAGDELGFSVTVVDDVHWRGERISSTAIRAALKSGDFERAAGMLGRPYAMSGRVVYGRGLGKDLGFPTANVNLKRRVSPVDGIFAVRVHGLDGVLEGVASVGSRPTIGGSEVLLEVFIFDFEADIYGRYITIEFVERLREERHFASLEAMTAQMHDDVKAARAALAA